MRLALKILSNKWVASYLIVMMSVSVASAGGWAAGASTPTKVDKIINGVHNECIQFSAYVTGTDSGWVTGHPNPAGPGTGNPPRNPIRFCDAGTQMCWDYWVAPNPPNGTVTTPGHGVTTKRWNWELCLPLGTLGSGDTLSQTYTFTYPDGNTGSTTVTYTHP